MTTFRITLAYDGTDFVGWQRQASGISVQGLIEGALRPLAGGDVAVAGAGRTDAGVHALGQVASFTIDRAVDAATLVRALNARLPPDVRVLTAGEALPTFHARFSARAKSYRYRIWNADVLNPFDRKYAWHLAGPLDVDAMARAAQAIEGEHDFAAFQASGSDAASTVRRITHCEVRSGDCGLTPDHGCPPPIFNQPAIRHPRSAMINFGITGTGFLRHMVRALVGSLVEVGRGRRPPEWIRTLIEGRDRTEAGPTAPAHGLFLVSVDYGDFLAAEP